MTNMTHTVLCTFIWSLTLLFSLFLFICLSCPKQWAEHLCMCPWAEQSQNCTESKNWMYDYLIWQTFLLLSKYSVRATSTKEKAHMLLPWVHYTLYCRDSKSRLQKFVSFNDQINYCIKTIEWKISEHLKKYICNILLENTYFSVGPVTWPEDNPHI